ncbi:NYN domain-containing protein [Sphaerisporangium album]|uniref:NYN domain-containing protein n=1 Tax=Sphaerisporangium album TaxID=509200 RepID=A0A367FD71_9ACTN|nr:NYN domain-containing protein [Sphaerisporangium album]RCG27859.1 NYN domain-containing protein [Sphaerisporangium album]
MTERVAVFLDFQNVHLSGHNVFERYGAPLYSCVPDPSKIADLIAKRRLRPSEAAAVRVYRGRPDPNHQRTPAAANDAQASRWERDPRVHMVRRQLNYRGWPHNSPQEKGIDVAIAVDLLHLAFRKLYDALVLFSSDTDLLPALQTITQLRLGHVEVACWSGFKPLRIANTRLPYCHFLNEEDWLGVVEDWTGKI